MSSVEVGAAYYLIERQMSTYTPVDYNRHLTSDILII